MTLRAGFTKGLRVLKRVQTWLHAQTHVEPDLLTGRTEDCVSQMGKIARAIHLACLPWWICKYGRFCQNVQNTGRSRCKSIYLACAMWFTKPGRDCGGCFCVFIHHVWKPCTNWYNFAKTYAFIGLIPVRAPWSYISAFPHVWVIL